jgi:adenylate cyclase
MKDLLAFPSGQESGSADQNGRRQRTTIAFADVIGYSAMMTTEEGQFLERWMVVLAEVIQPGTGRHRGRIVDLAGDGILAEFSEAAHALAWARELQTTMRERAHRDTPGAPPIVFRIAIHVGNVLSTSGRIFGDAVNIAARLQGHASPGGIVLSETAYADVHAGLGYEARDLGRIRLKNIDIPIRAYAIDTYLVRVAQHLPPHEALPTLAVLPLQILGSDPADTYFADGIVEDVVLSLSGLHELLVISPASTLSFRGRVEGPREAGRILGVRYILSGAVRRSSRSIRVSTELSDTETGAVLWADRIQTSTDGLFELQEQIVERVVAGLAPSVRAAELRRAMRKRPESMTAYDCVLRALHVVRGNDRAGFDIALDHLDNAMEADPGFALPIAWAARLHSLRIGQGWSSAPAEDTATAMALAERAIRLDPTNALALVTQGHVVAFLQRRAEDALELFDQALAACPSSSNAWTLSSATLSYLGRGADAVRHAEQGLRLSPFDPLRFSNRLFLAIAHYANGSYEEATRWARLSNADNPAHAATYKALAASLAAQGRIEEAHAAVARLLELEPTLRLSVYAETKLPIRDPDLRERMLAHLREAGVPE